MATAEEQALVERNVSNGVLVMHCSGGDERYEITKVPAETAFLVQDAKKKILRDLKLESVLKDLARASDFLYLAYLGVVGTGELQDRISRRQKDLSDLCAECVETMEALQQDSRTVLGRLTEAHSYLLEAKEELALRLFSRCAKNWSTVSIKCERLADGFRKMMDDTKEDAELSCKAWGDQVEEIEGLQKLRLEMEETKKRQEALSEEINISSEELCTEIFKEKERRRLADEQFFFQGIFGNIGAIFALAQHTSRYAEQPGPLPKLEEDRAIAEKAYGDASTALAEAYEKKEIADCELLEAMRDKTAKEWRLNAAWEANPCEAGHEEKVREAQTRLDASSASLKRVRGDQQKAQADVDKATENARGLGIAQAALELAESTQQISKIFACQSKELPDSILNILKKKSEQETLRHGALGQLAILTGRLQCHEQLTTMEHSAQTALEIATKALDNIYTSLSEAKAFWDSVQNFYANLMDPELPERIQDELNEGATSEERIQYYKSERFVPITVGYLCQWAALVSVGGEYVVSADRARRSVLEHMSTLPNTEEARKLIEPLQKKLMDELTADAAELDLYINKFKAGAEKMEALMKFNE